MSVSRAEFDKAIEVLTAACNNGQLGFNSFSDISDLVAVFKEPGEVKKTLIDQQRLLQGRLADLQARLASL